LGRLVLDTNVLACTARGEHTLRGPCTELMTAVAAGTLSGTTSLEVLQEFAHVHARERLRTMAAAQALRFVELLQPLVELSTDGLRLGLSLWQRHEQLSSLDAILAASCLNSTSTLVSADKAFARIRGLDHVVPDARGVKRLIAG
jgi:uncharacterized protein